MSASGLSSIRFGRILRLESPNAKNALAFQDALKQGLQEKYHLNPLQDVVFFSSPNAKEPPTTFYAAINSEKPYARVFRQRLAVLKESLIQQAEAKNLARKLEPRVAVMNLEPDTLVLESPRPADAPGTRYLLHNSLTVNYRKLFNEQLAALKERLITLAKAQNLYTEKSL